MTESEEFAKRIRERFPEGLTGILAVGGTRTGYILEHNRGKNDPGSIDQIEDYFLHTLTRMRELVYDFFELGGQNVIVPILSYQSFENERGAQYAALTGKMALKLMDEDWVQFYHDHNCDPYFVGIDTLLHFPQKEIAYQLGVQAARFNAEWLYSEGRRKIIWEIAPIPLFSLWRAHQVMGESELARLEAQLAEASNLQTVHDLLYRYYARAVYGTELPIPHFYLGSNRNGDLKLRAMLPISLLCGGPFRLFYTPYPTNFVTLDDLKAVLEDLAFGKRLRSTELDYTGKWTPELVEQEYQRVIELRDNPWSTIGMARNLSSED